ncbi:immunoglobulin gamma-1 heavy chain-like [Terrapene carolina triunguis]|uniref:immunoglobulin gamma-1 heavy chain-like n=1 Tax=Terrapene triunguis TaxID=2587831 RepID=UPI0011567E68|nr:immunoglobulin gamma-1 heavy chain-like [Terrapene carolina triunguis]
MGEVGLCHVTNLLTLQVGSNPATCAHPEHPLGHESAQDWSFLASHLQGCRGVMDFMRTCYATYAMARGLTEVRSVTASQEGIVIQQSPAQIFLASGKTAEIHCKLSTRRQYMYWYKELQNGSLHGIYQSYESAALPHEKYSSKVNIQANTFTLIISNVQRNDSGVYFCGLAVYVHPNFGNGTRLIVTDASEPRLSILVPSTPEDAELPPVIPLLCLLSDFTPPWSAVLWDTGEEASESQMDAGAIDGEGVFSVWSLTTIPSETWKQEMICACTAKENSTGRSINATVSKETVFFPGLICNYVLYVELSCIFILVVIQLLILLFRKCPTRAGKAVQTGNQIPMRHLPQTEYAAVRYNK